MLRGLQAAAAGLPGRPPGPTRGAADPPVQVSGGEPDEGGSDLTETALLPSVLPAPRETGTPLADGPGGRQGRDVVAVS